MNLYAIDEVKNAPAAAPEVDGYAYVTGMQYYFKGGKTTEGDLFNDKVEVASTAAAKAVIVNLDGSKEVIDLVVSYDKKADEWSVKGLAGEKVVIDESNSGSYEAKGAWVAYELVDGKYNFLEMSGATVGAFAVNNSYKAGELFLTNKTTYTNINIHEKNWKVTTHTGYKKMVVDAAEALVFTTTNEKTGEVTVTAIYEVTANAPETVETTATYAYAVKAGDTVADGTEWTFYINGKAETLVVACAVEAGSVYDLTINDKNVVTAAELVVAVDAEAAVEVTIVNEDYFVAGGTDYTYAKNIAVYNLKTGAVDTIEAGAKVVVAVATEGAAVLVYVVD